MNYSSRRTELGVGTAGFEGSQALPDPSQGCRLLLMPQRPCVHMGLSLSVYPHPKAVSHKRFGKGLHPTHLRFQRKAAPPSLVVKGEERPWEELGSLDLSLFLTLPPLNPASDTGWWEMCPGFLE